MLLSAQTDRHRDLREIIKVKISALPDPDSHSQHRESYRRRSRGALLDRLLPTALLLLLLLLSLVLLLLLSS